MGRRIALIAAVVLALALAACGKTISGSPSTVVEKAQDIKSGESVTVEVTGYADALSAGKKKESCRMLDDPNGSGKSVTVIFDSEVDIPSGRFTAKGSLYGNATMKDSAHVMHAKISK